MIAEAVLEAFPNATVTVQDFSPHMLAAARERLSRHSARLRTVLSEWTPLPARACNGLAVLFGLVLAVLGFRAIAAVVLP